MEDPHEEEIKSRISEIVSKTASLSQKEIDFEKKVLEKVLIEGETMQHACGISDNMMEYLYEQGFRKYQSGNYGKAEGYFYLLLQLNPEDLRFITGFAACKLKQEQYPEAINAYTFFAIIDPINPVPHYHQALIFQKVGQPEAASLSYQAVIRLCGDVPEFSAMKERSILCLKGLEGQIKAEGAKK